MEPSNSANGAMLSSTPPEIEVFSGGFVDLLNPDPKTLGLDDVARGMALTCRYGGHIRRFYSVAEHAVLVNDLLIWMSADRAQCLAGLFHDAAEAFLGDVVAPLKWAMREECARLVDHGRSLNPYDTLTERMEAAIAERFTIDRALFDTRDLRVADMWALRIEARELTRTGGAHWRWEGDLPNRGELPLSIDWYGGLSPDQAQELWLDRFDSYCATPRLPMADQKQTVDPLSTEAAIRGVGCPACGADKYESCTSIAGALRAHSHAERAKFWIATRLDDDDLPPTADAVCTPVPSGADALREALQAAKTPPARRPADYDLGWNAALEWAIERVAAAPAVASSGAEGEREHARALAFDALAAGLRGFAQLVLDYIDRAYEHEPDEADPICSLGNAAAAVLEDPADVQVYVYADGGPGEDDVAMLALIAAGKVLADGFDPVPGPAPAVTDPEGEREVPTPTVDSDRQYEALGMIRTVFFQRRPEREKLILINRIVGEGLFGDFPGSIAEAQNYVPTPAPSKETSTDGE